MRAKILLPNCSYRCRVARQIESRTDFTNVSLGVLQVADNPSADQDAANKKYVDDQIATVSGAGGVTGALGGLPNGDIQR